MADLGGGGGWLRQYVVPRCTAEHCVCHTIMEGVLELVCWCNNDVIKRTARGARCVLATAVGMRRSLTVVARTSMQALGNSCALHWVDTNNTVNGLDGKLI